MSAWTLFCFGVIVVPVYQFQAILLPVLLGGTCIALARNRRVEQREDVIAALKGRVDGINYAILCLISPLAALSYALMYEFEIRWPLAETICPPLTHVATAMYVFSFFYLLIKRPPGSGAPSQTPALGSGNASG